MVIGAAPSQFFGALLCLVLVSISTSPLLHAADLPVETASADGGPSPNETAVYVIREWNLKGGAFDFWVAANEQVIGSLDNGTHVSFNLRSGLNVINLVMMKAGFGFAAVDHRPGQTIYFAIDPKKMLLREISANEAQKLIAKTKALPLLPEPRRNDAYEEGVLNPGRLGLDIMIPDGATLSPDADSVVVTFFRHHPLMPEVAFDIWSESDYVGSLKGGTFFEVRVTPGKHTFISKSERYSVLNADLVAGKRYFVEFAVGLGQTEPHVMLLPFNARHYKGRLERLMKPLSRTSVNKTAFEAEPAMLRIARGNEMLADVRKRIERGELPSRQLESNDALKSER